MRMLRLSGRKVCERVKLRGALWKGKHMQARVVSAPPPLVTAPVDGALYVGTLTSAKLDKSAVRRNRMRRRCREAVRLAVRAAGPRPMVVCQLLLLPRSSSLSAPFAALFADASDLLRFLSHPRVTHSR